MHERGLRNVSSILILLIVVLYSVDGTVEVFTNHFHVHTKVPGAANAHKIAKRHGFINRGSVGFIFFYSH